MANPKLGKWAKIQYTCNCYDCERIATHVIFLNTPSCEPYCTVACSKCREVDDFPKVTLKKFWRAVRRLKELKVPDQEMPYMVMEILDPSLAAVGKEESK